MLALSLNMFEYEYFSILNVWALKQENRDFAFFSLYSDYSYPIPYFVKCRRTLLKLNFKGPWPSSEREIKFRRCLFTSSIKRKISHSVSRRSRAKTGKKQKSVMHVQSCCPRRWILNSLMRTVSVGYLRFMAEL